MSCYVPASDQNSVIVITVDSAINQAPSCLFYCVMFQAPNYNLPDYRLSVALRRFFPGSSLTNWAMVWLTWWLSSSAVTWLDAEYCMRNEVDPIESNQVYLWKKISWTDTEKYKICNIQCVSH